MKGNLNAASAPDTSVSPVNVLDLSRQYATIKEEMHAALIRVCDSGMFCLGPEVKTLEQSLATYCQVDHAVGCASGSDALLLALMALEIMPGDEVICPSFTFFATASCVTRLGATPIFADIDPVSFNITAEEIEKKITSRTQAIIPVHLYGQMCDMRSILNVTQKRGIPIIEDAAQAIGSEFDGRRAGSWGDMTALSFYPTKNLGGAGDGGMLTTPDAKLTEKLRLLRGHGMEPRYYHHVIGINSRLDAFQAAVLNVKLKYLEHWTAMRAENAARYTAMFTDKGLDSFVTLPATLPNRRHVWNQYVIRVPQAMRDSLRSSLTAQKLGTEIYYPVGLHEQKCFTYLGYTPESLPETFLASREVIALPMYPELTVGEQERVVGGIQSYFDTHRERLIFPAAAANRDVA